MTPQDASHIRAIEEENRELRVVLWVLREWIQHWKDDVSANLTPTPATLEYAAGLCAKALQKEPQS